MPYGLLIGNGQRIDRERPTNPALFSCVISGIMIKYYSMVMEGRSLTEPLSYAGLTHIGGTENSPMDG